jgi:hypothetical protein
MTIKLDRCISAAYADALFASALQCSDAPSPKQVRQAIAAAADAWGDRGCAARVAQAYGDPQRPRSRGCAGRVRRWPASSAAHGKSGHTPPKSRQCTMLYAGAQG